MSHDYKSNFNNISKRTQKDAKFPFRGAQLRAPRKTQRTFIAVGLHIHAKFNVFHMCWLMSVLKEKITPVKLAIYALNNVYIGGFLSLVGSSALRLRAIISWHCLSSHWTHSRGTQYLCMTPQRWTRYAWEKRPLRFCGIRDSIQGCRDNCHWLRKLCAAIPSSPCDVVSLDIYQER